VLTAIIATAESERALVPTLAALVPGSTSGLLSEVILADAASRDATAEVADIAGCRLMSSTAPLGTRFKAAAQAAKTPWLMFMRAGAVPEPSWVDAVTAFIHVTRQAGDRRAAAFRARPVVEPRSAAREFWSLLFAIVAGGPSPDQGLLIARDHYEAIGGHEDGDDAERRMIARIGRRDIALLSAAMGKGDIPDLG